MRENVEISKKLQPKSQSLWQLSETCTVLWVSVVACTQCLGLDYWRDQDQTLKH